jgi:hypothetical protein
MVALLNYTSPNLMQVRSPVACDSEDKKGMEETIVERGGIVSVRFADDIQAVREIPNRKCFSEQEIRDLYLSKFEQKMIHRNIVSVVRKCVEENDGEQLCDAEDDDLRGLEFLTRPHVERVRRLNRAVSAVLRRQRTCKIDEKWLSISYRPFSEAAARMAHKRGLRDQELVPSPVPRQVVMVR